MTTNKAQEEIIETVIRRIMFESLTNFEGKPCLDDDLTKDILRSALASAERDAVKRCVKKFRKLYNDGFYDDIDYMCKAIQAGKDEG